MDPDDDERETRRTFPVSIVAQICVKCCGYGDAHFLTCPTLRLPS